MIPKYFLNVCISKLCCPNFQYYIISQSFYMKMLEDLITVSLLNFFNHVLHNIAICYSVMSYLLCLHVEHTLLTLK